MFTAPLISLFLAATSLAAPFEDVEKRAKSPPSKELLDKIYDANTARERYAVLPPEDFLFDFLETPSFGGGGPDGGVVLADDNEWPGVIGNNIAMLMGFLGPCGMVAPHSHIRADEIYVNIAGPPLQAGIIPENGAPIIMGMAGPGTATILPRGSMHYITNTGCDPVTIVAGFNAESPGVLFMSTAYAAFDTQVYSAAFGGIPVTVLNPDQIPNTVIIGRQDCLDKCGLDRNTFNIKGTSNKDLMAASFQSFLKSYGNSTKN